MLGHPSVHDVAHVLSVGWHDWYPAATPVGVKHMLPYQKGHLLCGQAAMSGHCLCEASAGAAVENLPGTGL
jgi:hypothetical protein